MEKTQLKTVKGHCENVFKTFSALQDLAETMQEKYDSKSEQWQESEDGEKLHAVISKLEYVLLELANSHSELCDILKFIQKTYGYDTRRI